MQSKALWCPPDVQILSFGNSSVLASAGFPKHCQIFIQYKILCNMRLCRQWLQTGEALLPFQCQCSLPFPEIKWNCFFVSFATSFALSTYILIKLVPSPKIAETPLTYPHYFQMITVELGWSTGAAKQKSPISVVESTNNWCFSYSEYSGYPGY